MKEWIQSLPQKNFAFGKYSQSYQDELLQCIFANIGTRNVRPFCVEFGFNSRELTTGTGANVTRLIVDGRWDSLLIDGENENEAINLRRHFLTPENVCQVFAQYGVPKEPEYVSIDVDSTDLWLFAAVVKEYRAMVFSVEYNSHFPHDAAITFPNDTAESWRGDRGYGASLNALRMVAEANGYSLVWVVPRFDAFFVRNDLIADDTGRWVFDYFRWAECCSLPHHVPLFDSARASIFMDYRTYLTTGGDVAASKLAAQPVAQAVLCGR